MYLCVKTRRRPYLIRISDGYLLDGKKHRSLQSLIKKRKVNPNRDVKGYYEKNKLVMNEKRKERKRLNAEKENQRRKNWYYRNHARERTNEIQRRTDRDPCRIINHAISEYRSGSISVDGLNRRLDEAIKRTDDIYNKNCSSRRKSV